MNTRIKRIRESEMHPGLPAEDGALLESFASNAIVDVTPTRKNFSPRCAT